VRLLIGAAPSKLFHLEEFSRSLEKFGVETKIVKDIEYTDGYPSKNFKSWLSSNKKFEKLISDFKPDVIFVDRQRHFGLKSVNSKIPTIVYLRGDYWSEMEWAKETTYKSLGRRKALQKWIEIGDECFSKATTIVSICKYLDNIVQKKFPTKSTYVLQGGIDSTKWFHENPMSLKHPCVGLVQSATIWGKTRELLLLKKILPALPEITFYWVGDGPYANQIVKELEKFENFEWVGTLEYPKKVREFLSGIDIYALMSGIDMSPLTVQEAQLMKKPVLASDVGGVSELLENEKTGFLINLGDGEEWVKRISCLTDNPNLQKKIGEEGRKFIENNFSLDKIAEDFMKILNKIIDEKKS